MAFRLSGGAAAPLGKLLGTCVEIVFAGMGLCDRLVYASATLGANARFCRRPVVGAGGTGSMIEIWVVVLRLSDRLATDRLPWSPVRALGRAVSGWSAVVCTRLAHPGILQGR